MEADLADVFKTLSAYTKKPLQFLSVQGDVAEQLKKTVKKLYDITKSLEASSDNGALSELIVEGFDDEQVWQEVELQNEPVIASQVKQISRVMASSDVTFNHKRPRTAEQERENRKKVKNSQDTPRETEAHLNSEGEEEEEDEEHLVLSGVEDEDMSEEERQMEELLNKVRAEMGDASDEEEEEEDSEDDDLNGDFEMDMIKIKAGKSDKKETKSDKTSEKKQKGLIKKRRTVVDDKFFKLADMEMFLDQEDAKEEGKMAEEPEIENDSEEEVDYFADLPSDEEDKNLKYDDFFDPPEDVTDNEEKKQKSVKFGDPATDEEGETDLESDGDSVEGENVTDVVGAVRGEMSSFEKRQEKLKKKISELEEAALADKPWQLQGEVSRQVRPENSLLEEDLDYERTTRLAPVITEETTKLIEDMIKQRIKDKAWDDVERKVKPVEEPFEYKKKIVLDQEKSKLSLSQIYEQEYLRQQQKEEEEQVDPKHEEIKKMMTSLFIKLDALSNFHFTPKPAVPEVKIISNLPSISMEEVAPVGVSDANLMAPTEIKEKPKAEPKADTEKTETDRKRERREKKKRQQAYYKHQEEKLKARESKGLGSKQSKEKALKKLKKQSRTARGLKIIEDDEKTPRLTSSTQFFTKLQDEVSTHIKKVTTKESKKKADPAAKYKL